MKLLKKIPVLILVVFAVVNTHGQSTTIVDSTKNILLKKEIRGGILVHTRGWGLKFSRSNNQTFLRKTTLNFEVSTLSSLKEIRSINPWWSNSKPYVFGKLSQVAVGRAGFGIQNVLNEKPYWGGVMLSYFVNSGPSVAFAKPVYLYIWDNEKEDVVTKKYDPERHFNEEIYGRAPFRYGFNEITLHPGAYFQAGLDFEFGTYSTKVKALQIGVTADFYFKQLQILAYNDPRNFYLNFFVSFTFGKRYN